MAAVAAGESDAPPPPRPPAGLPWRKLLVAVAVAGLAVVVVTVARCTAAGEPVVGAAEVELDAVEADVLQRWDTAVGKIQAGELSDTAAAELIEQDLLPKWHAARLAYEQDGEGKIYALMVEYLRAREEGWTLIAQGLRAQDEAIAKRGTERFAEGDALIERIKAAAE